MLDLWSSDFAKAEDLPVPKYHEQMAVQLRRGEKAILTDNLEKIDALLSALGQGEAVADAVGGTGSGEATADQLDGLE